MQQDIRLISVDMDGTFLNPKGKVSLRNLEAAKKAQEAGIVFSIATGRFYENAAIGALDMGLNCPIISLNGAKISAAPLGRVIASHYMSIESAMQAYHVLEELGAPYYVFADRFVGIRSNKDKHHSQLEYGDERMRKETDTRFIYGREACLELIQKGIYKFYVHAYDDLAQLSHIRTTLQSEAKLSVLTQSSISNIEIMPPAIDKGSGIMELAKFLNIPLSQVMAIGDQENDLPMLIKAGLGVAMDNASQLVKDNSDVITLSNANDGVAHAIYTYALGQA
ncbi:MAG: HAD family phosphatase [Clostridiales bacterium]|nr:HAD family phosphatase [Clostridiales bacterium]